MLDERQHRNARQIDLLAAGKVEQEVERPFKALDIDNEGAFFPGFRWVNSIKRQIQRRVLLSEPRGGGLESCLYETSAASPIALPGPSIHGKWTCPAFITRRRSVLGYEAITAPALNFLAQSRGLIPGGQTADPDAVDRLAADLGLVDRGMETRQFPAKLFHEAQLNLPRFLFRSRGRELNREGTCHGLSGGRHRCRCLYLSLCVGDLNPLALAEQFAR